MSRFVCIHGHFYQPPRENPWLEEVELQDSARPYHDWNERILSECYEPNTAARILDDDDRIRLIVNNYARMSFNFGPTLLAWMERHAPRVHEALVEADRVSQERFSGHGSAMAQVYNHMILPLANARDRRTQVRWGIADFVHRFGRRPEGMWLAETAVDTPSLEALAEEGIRFTVLSPNQASRTRALSGSGEWQEATERLDTTRAYRVELPSGADIAVFFYDGQISQAIAFEQLLSSGETFRERLVGAFSQGAASRDGSLVHVATDGETYGHHHRYGDMALAYVLDTLDRTPDVELTNYGEYLERYPPTHAAEVAERSSWSCVHGVERWRSDCGCKTGGPPEWNQQWRSGLRAALDWLRDDLASEYEAAARELLRDPWAARDEYVQVVLRGPGAGAVEDFFSKSATESLSSPEQSRALGLLELQRQTMLMFTSCGWFFDDVSRIETLQILHYAGRAIELSRRFLDTDPEPGFLERLSNAKSNLAAKRDARFLYETEIRPSFVTLRDAAAHYVLCQLFDEQDRNSAAAFDYAERHVRKSSNGRARLMAGALRVTALVTRESQDLVYCALSFGGHNARVGVVSGTEQEVIEAHFRAMEAPFKKADFAEALRLLEDRFDGSLYSLKSLFHDQRQAILNRILHATQEDVEAAYGRIHDQHAPTMAFLKELGVTAPDAFTAAAQVSLHRNLRDVMRLDDRGGASLDAATGWLEAAESQGVPLDDSALAFAWTRDMERIAERCFRSWEDDSLWEQLERCLSIVEMAPFDVDLWKIQNGLYRLMQESLAAVRERAARGDSSASRRLERLGRIAERLSMRIPEP